MSSQKVTIPIPLPSPEHSTVPVRPTPFAADSNEGVKLKAMLDYFSASDLQLPIQDGSKELRGFDEWEKMYLSEDMMVRFLMAVKWNLPAAIKRLEANMVWRRTLGLYDVEGLSKELEPEFASGKIIILGYTRQSHPVLYTWPSKNTMPPSFAQVKHMMFTVERCMDLMVAGVQGLLFCADMSGKAQTQSGVMSVSRQILNGLQTQYPERLGGAGILSMPWLGSLFVTLLWPFIDTYTRNKIYINPDLSKDLIAQDQLLTEYGGNLDFEWTDEYLPALTKLCVTRRNENMERWKAAGGRVGISEWDFLPPFVGGNASDEKVGNREVEVENTPQSPTSSGAPVEVSA